MIIGLTGRNGSGKSTVGGMLKQNGFAFFSLSDILRDELRKQGKDMTRQNLIDKGNELREKHGPGVLGRLAVAFMGQQEGKDFAIDSIRNPIEIEELRKSRDFFLIGVSAPPDVRLARLKANGRAEHLKTPQDLLDMEAKENTSNSNFQQLDNCFALRDFEIENTEALGDVRIRLDSILDKINKMKKVD